MSAYWKITHPGPGKAGWQPIADEVTHEFWLTPKERRRVMRELYRFSRVPTLIHKGRKP